MQIQISNQHEDDYVRHVVTVLMTRDDNRRMAWKVPKRLMQREGMVDIVTEEMAAEMKEIWG